MFYKSHYSPVPWSVMEIFGMWWRSLVLSVIPYMWCAEVEGSTGIHTRAACLKDTFSISCLHGDVIIIRDAKYGRMHYNRCIQGFEEYAGCNMSVVSQTSSICSGRRECQIKVFEYFKDLKPCSELQAFFEAQYTCVTEQHQCLGSGVHITDTTGYISSYVIARQLFNTPHKHCRFTLETEPGKRWNLSLFSYGSHNIPYDTNEAQLNPYNPVCGRFATVTEEGADEKEICGDTAKQTSVHLSTTHKLSINVYLPEEHTEFLFKYEAVGCQYPTLPGATIVERSPDRILAECNNSREAWELVCENGKWRSTRQPSASCDTVERPWTPWSAWTEDWTTPYGLLMVTGVGILLGVIIGVLLLAIAVSCYRRKQRWQLQHSAQQAEHEAQALKCSVDSAVNRLSVERSPMRSAFYSPNSTPRKLVPKAVLIPDLDVPASCDTGPTHRPPNVAVPDYDHSQYYQSSSAINGNYVTQKPLHYKVSDVMSAEYDTALDSTETLGRNENLIRNVHMHSHVKTPKFSHSDNSRCFSSQVSRTSNDTELSMEHVYEIPD